MNRKIKALGLALVAALALNAVMASTASAQFTSSSTHTIYSGVQEGNLLFTAGEGFGSMKCTTVTVAGTSSSTNAADLTITPTYAGCSDSFGRTVHVDNTLTYTFTKTGTSGGTPIGSIHISGSLTLTTTSSGSVVCTVHFIAPQTVNGITYHNSGSGLKLTVAIVTLKSRTTGSFFSCGLAEGEHTEGTITGTMNWTGVETAGKPVVISVDP